MISTSNPKFKVRTSPEKGVFATEDVPAGTLLLTERNIIDCELFVTTKNSIRKEVYGSIMRQWRYLSNQGRREITSLPIASSDAMKVHFDAFKEDYSGVDSQPPKLTYGEASAIICLFSNGHSYVDDSGQPRRGLFMKAPQFNHSCHANVVFSISTDGVMFCRTSRNIDKGEELTMAFIRECYSFAHRRAELQRHWGFICACARCEGRLQVPALADIPGLGSFDMFPAELQGVAAQNGVDIRETWQWMQFHFNLIPQIKAKHNFAALYFPYRALADALMYLSIILRQQPLKEASKGYWRKAENIAHEFFNVTPAFAADCRTNLRLLDLQSVVSALPQGCPVQ